MPLSALVYLPGGHLVPVTIAAASDQAAWRFIDFFTANIRNPNTRQAYLRACRQFFAWCDERGRTLATIRPYDVTSYIEARQQTHSAPDVKQQLAAIRMLFDWLVTGQVVPSNPAAAIRGPKHVVKVGTTPVLEAAEWRLLFETVTSCGARWKTAILEDVAKVWSDEKSRIARAALSRQTAVLASGDVEGFHREDEHFHEMLSSFLNRDGVWDYILTAGSKLTRLLHLAGLPSRLPIVVKEHTVVVDALDVGDAQQVVAALAYHLDMVVPIPEQILDHLRVYVTD